MLNREEGRKEGRKKGREEGRKEGIKEGIKLGLKEAAERKGHEFVKNLLLNTDFEIARVAALAGVTEEFVTKVQSTFMR